MRGYVAKCAADSIFAGNGAKMNPKERGTKMLADVMDLNIMLPELYNYLPRNDYFRAKQLLEELELVLKKNVNRQL
ncbi:MAG: hypothetical protein ACRDF4_12300 [Rhabdochlamydiaceae bacterium]